eukprot:scpid20251/ scgid14546/ 
MCVTIFSKSAIGCRRLDKLPSLSTFSSDNMQEDRVVSPPFTKIPSIPLLFRQVDAYTRRAIRLWCHIIQFQTKVLKQIVRPQDGRGSAIQSQAGDSAYQHVEIEAPCTRKVTNDHENEIVQYLESKFTLKL